MSSPLAIAAVTAAFKDLLNDGFLNHDLSSAVGNINVTSSPPDRITTGAQEPDQLNLFLYQVTANQGWRNVNLPSRGSQQGERLSNPPLALDLHYLLSAYGSSDTHAEILLGYAMYLLHETPVITRERLHVLFGPSTPLVDGTILPGPFKNLSAENIADQVEMIKIIPNYLNSDELSKLWTAMQARYRPSMAYTVSVVLIQSTAKVRSAPPVLQRGKDDRGPIAQAVPYPQLNHVRPLGSDQLPAVRLGEELWVDGANFGDPSTFTARFTQSKLQTALLPAKTEVLAPNLLKLTLPAPAIGASTWSIGFYSLSLLTQTQDVPGHFIESSSSGIPVAIAPLITISPLTHTHGNLSLVITCLPRLLDTQQKTVGLLFGNRPEVAPDSIDPPDPDPSKPTTLRFTVPSVPTQTLPYMVRLRVDGIDSLPIKLVDSPPRQRLEIDPQQQVTVT